MKNISSIQKNNKSESPKTPGGISKSLLTPCRRVGLSRNWRKSGPSPFVSPLSAADSPTEPKQQQESRKRKSIIDETSEDIPQSDKNEDSTETQTSCNTPRTADTNRTPLRSLLPRKKSKTLILAKECQEESENIPQIANVNCDEKVESISSETKNNSPKTTNPVVIETDVVVTNKESPKSIKTIKLSRTNSKNNKYKIIKSPSKDKKKELSKCEVENKIQTVEDNCESSKIDCKQKSPENLVKECIVVIQKKIFKSDEKTDKIIKPKENLASQVLFDSDSDDTPLSTLNKKEKDTKPIIIDDEDEFQDNKKVKKLQHKTTSTSELKPKLDKKQKPKPIKNKPQPKIQEPIKSSQESIDLDDDDFVTNKRTILIKKTYDKIPKLSKAKSTGSITQKDIDKLKERIEAKKNLLLAKAMTPETEELRSLIKKWQKGCQNALTELLDLMKKKMPEQKNMEYSEILQLLKIPPDLVGYDSENDCFVTPDDATIILSGFDIK